MRVDGGEGRGDDAAEDREARSARREAELDALAGRAGGGDRAALEQLLALIRPIVMRYCRARMGAGIGLMTPEDVAQDILIAICGALKRYRPDTRAMSLVYGIARNKVVDAFRAAGRDQSDPTDSLPETVDAGRGPDMEAVLNTEVDELRALLARLPAAQREVLVLRVALGFSAEEAARTVGSTSGAVRVTQHRAMAKLRALVTERR